MLKILYLDHAPIMGGAEKALLDLLRSLDRQRYQPVVATASDSAFLPILASEGIRTTTTRFEQVNVRHPAFLLRLVRSTLALVGLVRREHPDVLHSNTVRGHVVSSLASTITGVPLVWTMHDRTLPIPFFRLLGRVPRRIIFVSQYLSGLYMTGESNRQRGQVIPNGAMPAPSQDRAEARRKLGLPPDSPVIVNVGRLVDGKGQDVFLQSAELIALRWPDAVFILVGGENDGDPASSRYAQQLRRLANAPGLAGKAVFAGYQPDTGSYYAAADLCAYTAVTPEGFGLVILEAMAHGRAVVASKLGAVPEMVLDGVTGRLVQPNEVVALAETVIELLGDREAISRFGAAGRQRVAEHFDPQEGFRKIQAVYDEVLIENRAGRR